MKTNTRHIVVIGVFVLLFFGFILILLRPSNMGIAQKKINQASGIDDVKSIYLAEKEKLGSDEDFLQSIREKLMTFNPNRFQIQEIKKWLPAVHSNLNIILVPDLSYRLRDTINNPGQPVRDKELLNIIWQEFKKNSRLKMDTKDRLLVDIADPDQADGQFRNIADSLVFDLSTFKNKSNRFFFNKVDSRFTQNISALYQTATKKTTGADYVYYFAEKLPSRIKESNLEDDYRNIVIILTDGYLEVTLPGHHGKSISPNSAELRKLCGNSSGVPAAFIFPRQTMNSSFPNAEVYLFEVNERKNGKNCDFSGLKQWWNLWFQNMHVANAGSDNIFKREEAISMAKNKIESLF